MKNISVLLVSLFFLAACSKTKLSTSVESLTTDDFKVTERAVLSDILKESSGLEIIADGDNGDLLLSHNDHKGDPKLYGFDSEGQLKKTYSIQNASNEDWEDLAQDKSGHLYIGDFGNNDNDRQDLKIYKVNVADFFQNNSINSSIIHFNFENQTDFPPSDAEQFFDVEAFIAQGDFLYLFTKDRSKPFAGKTTLYRLPNTVGNHSATLLAEWSTDNDKDKGRITAADISPDGQTLALLSNEVVWLFDQFAGADFFEGRARRIDLPYRVQMEGMVWKDNCSLYLSNEHESEAESQLYQLDICN